MSERFPILQPDNPCAQCPGHCCDPFKGGLNISVPLPPDHIYQMGGAELVMDLRSRLPLEMLSAVSELTPQTSDNRFRLDRMGFLSRPLRAEYLEDLPRFFKGRRQMVRFVRSVLILFFSCDAFYETQGVCTRYETRPKQCVDFSFVDCGFSPVSIPIPERDFKLVTGGLDSWFFKDPEKTLDDYWRRLRGQTEVIR